MLKSPPGRHGMFEPRREELTGDPTRDLIGTNVSFPIPLFRDPAEHYYLWVEDALSIPSALFKAWDQRHGRERRQNQRHEKDNGSTHGN